MRVARKASRRRIQRRRVSRLQFKANKRSTKKKGSCVKRRSLGNNDRNTSRVAGGILIPGEIITIGGTQCVAGFRGWPKDNLDGR